MKKLWNGGLEAKIDKWIISVEYLLFTGKIMFKSQLKYRFPRKYRVEHLFFCT
jgi:hypothetical protein